MKKSIMKFILFLLRNRKHDKPARVQKYNLTEQVNRFLQNSYLFRYNLLTDETEYRPANAADKTFVGTKISAVFSSPNMYLSIILSCFILNSFPFGMASTG